MRFCKQAAALAWVAATVATMQAAHAADIAEPIVEFSPWYVSVSGGLNTIFESDIDGGGLIDDGEVDFDWGWKARGAVGYYWTENWRTEIEAAYSRNDADEFDPDDDSDIDLDGSLDIFSVLAKIDYEFQLWWFRPYFGVGAGVAVLSADDIEPEGVDASFDGDDTVFAGAVEWGTKFILSDNLEFFTQSQLLIMSDADFDISDSSSEVTLEDPLVWSSTIGLRFRF
jgi:opacity protein-like surface antigen